MPELMPVFTWLAGQLENGPGVARLSGVPVERLARNQLRRLFWGFCVNLGTPMYQTAAGEILGEVKDRTQINANDVENLRQIADAISDMREMVSPISLMAPTDSCVAA